MKPMKNNPPRWRVSLFTLASILGVIILSFAVGYYLQMVAPRLVEEEFLGSNLGFFILINFNVVVVLILGFLTIQNLVKLILDRRRNILGSRLRSKLVGAFVGLSLVPTVLLFLVAKGILGSVLQGWFTPQVTQSVEGALTIAKENYDLSESKIRRDAMTVARRIEENVPGLGRILYADTRQQSSNAEFEAKKALQRFLQTKQEELGLAEISLVKATSDLRAEAVPFVATSEEALPGLDATAVRDASSGRVVVRSEEFNSGEILRCYFPLSLLSPLSGGGDTRNFGKRADAVLVTGMQIPKALSDALSSVLDAYDDFRELGIYRRPLASSYLLALIVITLLVIFSAIWVGFYLARSLSVPIQLLAAGTGEIAQGNLDFRIPEIGDDEMSVLVRSFNKMTADLQETTGELVERRRYMEAVLTNVGVGVVSVDSALRITTMNKAAKKILGLNEETNASGKPLANVVPRELAVKARELMDGRDDEIEKVVSANLSLYLGAETKHIQVSATKLYGERAESLGGVFLVHDLTELVSAQRMAAWREVARRIAHEIKNPLTPIQLSAQRMQRRFESKNETTELNTSDREVIAESTSTIVNQVEALRRLVNEFSRFARMPKATPVSLDLNQLITEVERIFRDAHHDITFRLVLDSRLPLVKADRDQLGRVLMNLLDNAVSSVHEANKILPRSSAEIIITSAVDEDLGLVTIAVSDSGVGVSDTDKPKLFEPYFSTKKGGSGLGLAIVSSIVADHNGFIRVRDNEPRGATFVVELPVPKSSQFGSWESRVVGQS